MEEKLPPACAFAISVLAEYKHDPDTVPEEAIEAAQEHVAICPRCKETSHTPTTATTTMPPKKKRSQKTASSSNGNQSTLPTAFQDASSLSDIVKQTGVQQPPLSATATSQEQSVATIGDDGLVSDSDTLGCQQCRALFPEYIKALGSGQNVVLLYPELQEHLLTCESGCLMLLELLLQEAKETRKHSHSPVYNPFKVIGWELTGFFRSGQIPMSSKALAYGTLMLLLIAASLSAFLVFFIDHQPPAHLLPTPDGIGLSDGLKIFDACNAIGYQDKRDAAQAMQNADFSRAGNLLTSAISTTQADTTGCNGAEAAIYHEDLQVRLSKRPFESVVVSFDSGPGNVDPQSGTDRHTLYAADTQELIGAYISQQLYNKDQLQTPGAPLLYLVLANTTGEESGALQIANTVVDLAQATDYQRFGLQAQGTHPLLGILGFGPSSLAQVVLPTMCRAGIPLIAPSATGQFVIDQINQISLYHHCTPGFSFVRISADDTTQSSLAAGFAYTKLNAQNVAIFYDPSNPSSKGSAQSFIDNFTTNSDAHIVAQEAVTASALQNPNEQKQALSNDVQAALQDALRSDPRPEIIFAPLPTSAVTVLGQAIAHLPQGKQPILLTGGGFVQPTALQKLVQWARQNQLTLPPLYATEAAAAQPSSSSTWQKQFYGSFCRSFATPGSFCSGATVLDQGALLFGDSIRLITRGIGSMTDKSKLPSRQQFVQRISSDQFIGVSSLVTLQAQNNVITSTTLHPVVLGIQQDGSVQIAG
ncbi:MAG TPA: hypothetical protein VGL94_22975 [Ktedonobacteraceae bacterium]